MYKVNLHKEGNLSVRMKLDLTKYLKNIPISSPLIPLDTLVPLEADSLNEFAEERKKLEDAILDLSADVIWIAIKELIAEQCDKSIVEHNLLSSYLRSNEENGTPHALESLNGSFPELLKNWVDALIKKYLSDGKTTTLEVLIACKLVKSKVGGDCEECRDDLVISMIDNGCGFPEEYMRNFQNYLHEKSYKFQAKPSEKQENYFFGGAGKGLPIFLAYFIDGEILEDFSKPIKVKEVAGSNISISINKNVKTQGAEITLVSPLKPLAALEENQDDLMGTERKPVPILMSPPAAKFKKRVNFFLEESPQKLTRQFEKFAVDKKTVEGDDEASVESEKRPVFAFHQ
ncbi:sensor histidine kinase [Legionella septentrionalis]|uniref:sensor histidine kinase n=1 Tax=Legionella septentrionalis TaxID=2498109 RepID=UPI000F8F4F4D|nr:sensor histidine kinase [Legionella septentrionalis]RUR14384.1 hypothetical protein ELY10_08975 [Legionella septentrionalis]